MTKLCGYSCRRETRPQSLRVPHLSVWCFGRGWWFTLVLCVSLLQPNVTPRLALNDIIYRAFTSAGIPATKEPATLTHLNGKRPDSLTVVPWCAGKALTWDVTAVSTLADSYVVLLVQEAGAPAELAASRKTANTHFYHNLIISNQLPLKLPALSTVLLLTFLLLSVVASVPLAAQNVKVFSFFNASLSLCSASMPFFFTTVLFAMIRTSSHSSCF